MKLAYSPIAIALLFVMQTTQADLVSDGELIMDGAQKVYPEFFPSKEKTQVLEPWRFRFYPQTGIYVGVNQQDLGVYLLGGILGDSPIYVNNSDAVLAMINSQLSANKNDNLICETSSAPDGFIYEQSDNTVNITTNGQCIKLPDNPNYCDVNPETDDVGAPVATNIHVLTTSDIAHFELQGLSFPGIDDIARQAANTSTCIIHAPAEFLNYTVNTDICLDITDTLSGYGLPILGRVTTHLVSSSFSTQVSDCFVTDADAITNIVTKELWTKDLTGSGFTKIN